MASLQPLLFAPPRANMPFTTRFDIRRGERHFLLPLSMPLSLNATLLPVRYIYGFILRRYCCHHTHTPAWLRYCLHLRFAIICHRFTAFSLLQKNIILFTPFQGHGFDIDAAAANMPRAIDSIITPYRCLLYYSLRLLGRRLFDAITLMLLRRCQQHVSPRDVTASDALPRVYAIICSRHIMPRLLLIFSAAFIASRLPLLMPRLLHILLFATPFRHVTRYMPLFAMPCYFPASRCRQDYMPITSLSRCHYYAIYSAYAAIYDAIIFLHFSMIRLLPLCHYAYFSISMPPITRCRYSSPVACFHYAFIAALVAICYMPYATPHMSMPISLLFLSIYAALLYVVFAPLLPLMFRHAR